VWGGCDVRRSSRLSDPGRSEARASTASITAVAAATAATTAVAATAAVAAAAVTAAADSLLEACYRCS